MILVIFPIYGNKWKKNVIIMKKKFCAEKLNFGLLPKYIARLGSWAGRWARLLGVQALGARGVRGRAGEGAGVGTGRWQQRAGRAGGSSARARSAGGRASRRRHGRARARAGSGTAGREGAQAAGRQARAR